MKPYIKISIRTKIETTDWAVGEKFIDSLGLEGGLLIPELISHNADRFRDPFMGKALCRDVWASKVLMRGGGFLLDYFQDFAWKRRRFITSKGRVAHTKKDIKDQLVPGSISFYAAFTDKVDWHGLFKTWCEIFPPQLGMLHVFAGPELAPSAKYDSFQIGSFNALLKPEVPNIGWAMVYGDEFAQEVNVRRIVEAGFVIENIGNGYLVRVTDSINDVVDDFWQFSRRRAELKKLFRDGFFLAEDEPTHDRTRSSA